MDHDVEARLAVPEKPKGTDFHHLYHNGYCIHVMNEDGVTMAHVPLERGTHSGLEMERALYVAKVIADALTLAQALPIKEWDDTTATD